MNGPLELVSSGGVTWREFNYNNWSRCRGRGVYKVARWVLK